MQILEMVQDVQFLKQEYMQLFILKIKAGGIILTELVVMIV